MGMLLAWIPNSFFQNYLLTPMKYAVGGTIFATQLALRYGWAFNLAGGFHHAKANSGEGGCVFADIPIAIHTLWKENPNLKIMIIDLDIHQGNGNESILGKEDGRIFIFDMFNKNVEHTDDRLAKLPTVYAVPLQGGHLSSEVYGIPMPDVLAERCVQRLISTHEYMAALKEHFPKAMAQCIKIFGKKPDLIIYNAGTDVHENDEWGCTHVSSEGIYARDQYIFQEAFAAHIPIVMLPSGGYFKESAQVIATSITNIIRSVIMPTMMHQQKTP